MALPHIPPGGSRTPRLRHIPLPSVLAPGASASELHPILQRGTAPLAMVWDMRTPAYRAAAARPPWFEHPATYPNQASIIVRAQGGSPTIADERPIVVFPGAGSTDGVVTVMDILDAVHRFVAAQPNQQRIWLGLTPSSTECEVWVLHTT